MLAGVQVADTFETLRALEVDGVPSVFRNTWPPGVTSSRVRPAETGQKGLTVGGTISRLTSQNH